MLHFTEVRGGLDGGVHGGVRQNDRLVRFLLRGIGKGGAAMVARFADTRRGGGRFGISRRLIIRIDLRQRCINLGLLSGDHGELRNGMLKLDIRVDAEAFLPCESGCISAALYLIS